jgi:DNA-binding beta-propeller fold protein YncE
MKMRLALAGLSAAVVTMAGLGLMAAPAGSGGAVFRSPYDVAYSPDGKLVAVSDHTAGAVVILDAAGKKVSKEIALNGSPKGLAWSADGKLYVAESGAQSVAEVDVAGGKVARRFTTGRYPGGVAVANKAKQLLVSDWGLNLLYVFDLAGGKELKRLPMVREPRHVAVSRDESTAVVTNSMPYGSAADATSSCVVNIVDLVKQEVSASIKLPPGSIQVRGVVISPDGKWAYLVHCLGRFTLPTTQLDRGWINTNAMSIIDLTKKEHYATCLLDRLTEGAADPWGAAISKDGNTLWVTLAGVHQLARVDLAKLHLLMNGQPLPPPTEEEKKMNLPQHLSQIWGQIKDDPKKRELLANDLAALYGAGLLVRMNLDAKGPRGIGIAPDGNSLAIGNYFTGDVIFTEGAWGKAVAKVAVGKQGEPDAARKGEQVFFDATYSFQHWLSCGTCHPDGRADGLNWDLLNDGIGNPKNNKSLLMSDKTPPSMALGVRSDFGLASEAGFRFILFREPEKADVESVKTYIQSMKAQASPLLTPDGKLTARAEQGKKIFEDAKTGCVTCHPAPLYTDLKMYNVGTKYDLDREAEKFDTPTLIELWRTGPYLHSGEAKTVMDVLTTFNKGNQHGNTTQLSKEQLEALAEYLLSL